MFFGAALIGTALLTGCSKSDNTETKPATNADAAGGKVNYDHHNTPAGQAK